MGSHHSTHDNFQATSIEIPQIPSPNRSLHCFDTPFSYVTVTRYSVMVTLQSIATETMEANFTGIEQRAGTLVTVSQLRSLQHPQLTR